MQGRLQGSRRRHPRQKRRSTFAHCDAGRASRRRHVWCGGRRSLQQRASYEISQPPAAATGSPSAKRSRSEWWCPTRNGKRGLPSITANKLYVAKPEGRGAARTELRPDRDFPIRAVRHTWTGWRVAVGATLSPFSEPRSDLAKQILVSRILDLLAEDRAKKARSSAHDEKSSTKF